MDLRRLSSILKCNNCFDSYLCGVISDGNFISIYLVAGSLPGRSYLFKLKSTDTVTQSEGMAEILVRINDAPLGGTLSVTPFAGFALNTTFQMVTHSWLDDNLPLLYTFSTYTVSAEKKTVVRPPTTALKVSTYLTQGMQSQEYVVTCLLEAIDTYGAKSSTATAVKVEPVEYSSVSVYKSAIDNLLVEALSSSDADLFSQVIAGATATINAAECIYAPPCYTLNREGCSIVPNTCGECLPSFVGVSGHSNTLCRELPSSANSGRRRRLYSYNDLTLLDPNSVPHDLSMHLADTVLKSDGSTCVLNSECASYFCDREICQTVSKICPNACSGQGDCVATDINGNVLEVCTIQDSYCSVT